MSVYSIDRHTAQVSIKLRVYGWSSRHFFLADGAVNVFIEQAQIVSVGDGDSPEPKRLQTAIRFQDAHSLKKKKIEKKEMLLGASRMLRQIKETHSSVAFLAVMTTFLCTPSNLCLHSASLRVVAWMLDFSPFITPSITFSYQLALRV